MKKQILFIIIFVIGIFVAFPQKTLAYNVCSSSQQTNCCQSASSSSLGECIGSTILYCSDETTCMTTDTNASWISPTTSNTTTSTNNTTSSDNCLNQTNGDCTSSQLPVACSVGMSYDCCNTEQACYDLPGVPVPHANPGRPTSAPVSVPVDTSSIATISDLGNIFERVVGYVLGLAGIVLFVLLLVSGFKFITSGGDPKAVEGARKTLTSAIAGLIIILVAYLILVLITNITGVNVTNFSILIPS